MICCKLFLLNNKVIDSLITEIFKKSNRSLTVSCMTCVKQEMILTVAFHA